MSIKKLLRIQRHQTEAKITDQNLSENQSEGSEKIIKDKKGLKKSIVYKGSKYTIGLNKE